MTLFRKPYYPMLCLLRQRSNPYQVRLVQFSSGERMPLRVVRASGVPLFMPTLHPRHNYGPTD
jgi:hypothetical protein